MTVSAMLRSAELQGDFCQAETIERAKRALRAGVAARAMIGSACDRRRGLRVRRQLDPEHSTGRTGRWL
jgi:hypothetical protein